MSDIVYVATDDNDDRRAIKAVFDNEDDLRAFLDSEPSYIGSIVETWKVNAPEGGHLKQHGFAVRLYNLEKQRGSNSTGLPNVDGWLVRECGEEDWDLTDETVWWSSPGYQCDILGRDRDHALEVAHQVIAEQNAQRDS